MKRLGLILATILLIVACAKKTINTKHAEQPTESTNETEDSNDSDELIVGGHTVTKKTEVAATTVSLVNTAEGTLCTASIISDQVALTAAHCVDGDPNAMQISFGVKTLSRVTRPVIETIVSPLWHQHQHEKLNNGDMALVRFAGGLPVGATPVSIMKSSHQLSDGEIVTLAGFGISNARNDSGSGRLRMVSVKIAKAHFSQTEVSLDQTNDHGACHGDSGGPAFIQDNAGGLQLWGVTSRGINDPANHCAGQSVYTRVQPYARWINSVIRSWKN